MLELNKIYNRDCRDGLQELNENSIDAIITDPPYEIGFMGKSWDASGIAYNVQMWKEVLCVLKPGGHLLSFGGSRTYHRMACTIEDAGFEIRDQIMWVYGSGFPKSLDISKAIDKMKGENTNNIPITYRKFEDIAGDNFNRKDGKTESTKVLYEHVPTTQESKEWSGWGTALKPAHEPIVLARKPLSEKTVAENVLRWGVGGLNIDGCRIKYEQGGTIASNPLLRKEQGAKINFGIDTNPSCYALKKENGEMNINHQGRFPANLIHDGSDEVTRLFPDSNSSGGQKSLGAFRNGDVYGKGKDMREKGNPGLGDSGSASRFFYCAKASKTERNNGLDGMPLGEPPASARSKPAEGRQNPLGNPRANHHPTVKPLSLMEYLIKLITRENQIVLDPFIGSGTTALVCKRINRRFIGFEINQDYCQIAEKRLRNVPERLDKYVVEG